jgi:hypothetical protein
MDPLMGRRQHTPEQIKRKLVEGQKLLAVGMDLKGVCRQLGNGQRESRVAGQQNRAMVAR